MINPKPIQEELPVVSAEPVKIDDNGNEKLRRHVITYNQVSITINEAYNLLRQILGERFTEDRLTERNHLQYVGSSILELSQAEFDLLESAVLSKKIKGIIFDYMVETQADTGSSVSELEVNTTTFVKLPNLELINAYNTGYTGNGINIAVLDSGIDQSNMKLESSNILFGIDCTSLISSSATAATTPVNVDTWGHGTACAGIIAGQHGYGIAPDVKLYNVKVINNFGFGTISTVLTGLNWIASNQTRLNIHIINMSFAVATDSTDDIAAFVNVKLALPKCFFVAASGNNGGNIKSPANISGIIAVSAIDNLKKFWGSSSYKGRRRINITAPGVDVQTILPNIRKTGTSMACAHVSGVLALIKQKYPKLQVKDIRIKLFNASTYGLKPIYTDNKSKFGAGLVNCNKCLFK